VTVPGGATSASFAATVNAVSSATTVTITATTANSSQTFALQLGASSVPVLTGLTCANASMTGAGTDSCTVTLNAAAATGGYPVNLASNNSAVTVPATVTVPGGATSVGFSAAVNVVSSAQTAILTASAGGTTQSFSIQLGGSASLIVSTSSINFGDVLVNTPSTQTLTLSNTSTTPITVSAATTTGTGFSVSGATFPVVLTSGQPATLQIVFNPAAAGSSTGTLTIATTSPTNPAVVVTLSGTGVTVAYQVNLTWDAPNSLDDPIAGFDVFRSGDGGITFLPMTNSPVTQTAYTDLSVQDGQAYVYMVVSVDSAGVQSPPSNLANVTIPAGP
jgi:Abnormal spindle-like microcephaly-assoc'd, ASPM-SPD-2-Hydin